MRRKPPLLQRLRAKKQHAAGAMVVGVSWYTESEWAKVKAFARDPEVFESSFPEWCTMAEDALREVAKAGINPVKVLVSAEELRQWCESKGKHNNASARAEFVSEKLRSENPSRA